MKARWWSSSTCDLNGVFKGGGAKGVLYAGALQAVMETGHWFSAVAGASAGAITASLVAAGVPTGEFAGLAEAGLRTIKRNWLFDLVGQPHIKTKGLREWLEQVLVEQVIMLTGSRSSDGLISFEELFQATGIELFVVCVDVAERQPLVFGSRLTPNLSVTDAVIASSSIPFAFRPGRLRMTTRAGADEVHRLMDGGVWANYPTFVFKDPSFRKFHDLEALPGSSVTVGFTLDSAHADVGGSVPVELERSAPKGHDRGAGLKGWLRNPIFRLYLLTLVPLVMVAEFMWTTSRYGLLVVKDNMRGRNLPAVVDFVGPYFDGFFSHNYPPIWVVAAAITLMALVLLLVGATLLDSAFPAMRTLMAVGTDVPYWSGSDSTDHVVRLAVPEGLTTMSFTVKPANLPVWVEAARVSAQKQLATMIPVS